MTVAPEILKHYPDRPFPKGHVQVMTIHQTKGLKFPVVVVGSLSKLLSSAKGIDRDLAPFYRRPPFEPENRITLFDRMRLHYVAFSRPQKLLVLTAHEPPKDHFAPIWQGLPQWPYVETELLAAQRFALRERMPVKKGYSFTGDLKIYETCPRQYQFFREYDFTPSRSAVIFFGLLDFKTSERSSDPALLSTYEDQLCTYAHVLERRHGKHPERLLLYWTAEPNKSAALMEIPYRPEKVAAAGQRFDQVVSRIQARDFTLHRVPESKVCKECDLKTLCGAEGKK